MCSDVIEKVESRLEEIESDDRLHYDPADVRVNAPLALEQARLKAQKAELDWFLSILEESSDHDLQPDTDQEENDD